MASAPHLPKINQKKKTDNTKIIIVFVSVFFGLLSGGTAALVVSAWITPGANNISNGFVFKNEINQIQATVDALTERQISERIISVYTKNEVSYLAYNKQEAFVGDAIVLSSDGWAALQVSPQYKVGEEWSWFGADRKGTSYKIKKTTYDQFSHIVYIQFEGSEFYVASFADWSQLSLGTDYIFSNQYNHAQVSFIKNQQVQNVSQYIYQDPKLLQLQFVQSKGLLFTQNGSFVGFIDNDGVVTIGYLTQQSLSQVLTQKPFVYKSIKIKGKTIDAIVGDNQVINQIGFLVTEVTYPFNKEIKVGDIIIAINGQVYDPQIAFQQVLSADEQVRIRVLRQQKDVDITVKKQPI